MAVRRLAAYCLLWLLAMATVAAASAPGGIHTFTEARVHRVFGGQPVAPGDRGMPVTLPHEWESGFAGYSGMLEYRMRFDTPPPGALLGVYVQRACSNLEVSVNGELIGSGGRMTAPVTRNCYYPHLFTLPRSLLHADGNVLVVRLVGYSADSVSARQRAGGLSAVQIGPMALLQDRYDEQRFWNITVAQIIATSIAGLGTAMLCLWLLRRRDAYLLYFGLFTMGWALISVRLFLRDVPVSHHAAEVLICSAFPPVLGCAYLFLLRLVDRRRPWVEGALALQAVMVPIALIATPAQQLLPVASTVYNLLALEFLVTTAYFFRVAWKTHRKDFWLLGSVLLVALVLAGAEVALQNDLLPLPKVHLIHFAMPLVFAVIGLRLIQLFVRALHEAETINEQLERRVAQKSLELESNWEQIARLRTAQAAQDERQRIASDLHDDLGAQLLSIAQASQQGGEPDRIARLARSAMEEMRLSVRGLTGRSALTEDVLADWRSETVTRLAEAGFEIEWHADDAPEDTILPARTHVQLTRILREAVSNTIRHSGGRRCRVGVSFPPGALMLELEDDGRGMPDLRPGRGHGMLNIERRARNLGGEHRFERGSAGGTRLCVRVPLVVTHSNWGQL